MLIHNYLAGVKMRVKMTGKAGTTSATRQQAAAAGRQTPVSPPPPGACCCATMSSPLTALSMVLRSCVNVILNIGGAGLSGSDGVLRKLRNVLRGYLPPVGC